MKLPWNRGEKDFFHKLGKIYFFKRLPSNFLLTEDLPPEVSRVCDAIVLIYVRYANGGAGFCGTGLVYGGAVLTAFHVVKNAESIWIKHKDRDIRAREIARNKDSDFALLEPEEFLPAPSVELARGYQSGYGKLYTVGYLWLKVKEAHEGKEITYRKILCAYTINGRAQWEWSGKFSVAIPSMVRPLFGGFSGGVIADSHGIVIGMIQATCSQWSWNGSRVHILGARGHKMRRFFDRNKGLIESKT